MNTLKVFNIEKYRIHDGAGIRTAVFLKGCHLRCPWCSNPESQSINTQMAIFRNLCVSCLLCEKVCSEQAVFHTKDRCVETDISKCNFCGKCVSMCPRSARKIYGNDMSVEEVMKVIEKDAAYYSRSGGGITITGGEPLLQWDVVGRLIDECHMEMFSVTIETCGFIEPDKFRKSALKADELLIDVKTTDPQQTHIIFGKQVDGQLYLSWLKENIKSAVDAGKEVVIRCPIIPKFNNNLIHIQNVIAWAKEVNCKRIDLLPFHQYGKVKYQSLDMKYKLTELQALENQDMEQFSKLIETNGIKCVIGG